MLPVQMTFVMFKIVFLQISLLFCVAFPTLQTWESAKNEDNIEVLHRLYGTTSYREVRGVMQLTTSPQSLLALIKDDTAGVDWINRIGVFKTIKTISDQEWYTYAELNIPFPFQNRDLISRNVVKQKGNTIVVEITSVPQYLAENKGKVRIKKSEGFWQFTDLGNGKTEVVYQFYTEPNIALPRWFTEPLVVSGIHKTLRNMREYVKKEKYQKIKP